MNAGMQCMYQCPSDGLDLVVDEMDGRMRYLLRYGMVWYGTTFGRRRDACMYACVRARVLGWAVLGWAVRCWAVLGGAELSGAVRCWLHCRSLMKKKKMKVKDKKRT